MFRPLSNLLVAVSLTSLTVTPVLAQAAYPSYPQVPAPQVAGAPAVEPLAQPVPETRTREASVERNRTPAELRPLGLEQKAWSNPRANMDPRQSMPGFLRVNWRPDTVTTINVREGMLTVIRWPVNENILSRELSDKKTFESRIGPDQRSIIVRSVYAGVDGNMVVYGQSGNVYNIYLRSIPFNSERLPDTTVEMIVGGLDTNYGGTLRSNAPVSPPYSDYRDLYTPTVTTKVEEFKEGSREWANAAAIRGRDMDTNIDILVPDRADQAIAPIRAWHDKNMTYLDFGPNAGSMNQWPVASLVIDGSESPVGSRTTGPNGSIMIIEAVGDIVLRNGRHLVCLKLRNQPDNRVSPSKLVAQTDNLPAAVSVETVAVPPRAAPATVKRRPKVIKADAAPTEATSVKKATVKAPEAPVAAKAIATTNDGPKGFTFDASGLTGKIQ